MAVTAAPITAYRATQSLPALKRERGVGSAEGKPGRRILDRLSLSAGARIILEKLGFDESMLPVVDLAPALRGRTLDLFT